MKLHIAISFIVAAAVVNAAKSTSPAPETPAITEKDMEEIFKDEEKTAQMRLGEDSEALMKYISNGNSPLQSTLWMNSFP